MKEVPFEAKVQRANCTAGITKRRPIAATSTSAHGRSIGHFSLAGRLASFTFTAKEMIKFGCWTMIIKQPIVHLPDGS
jgi:hypothetical protein